MTHIPCLLALVLRYVIIFIRDIFRLSTATGTPLSNSISKYSAGMFLFLTKLKISSGGSIQGFSNFPASIARPHIFMSVLYFLISSLSGTLFFFAYLISRSLVRFISLIGAIIFIVGSIDDIAISNLT